MSAFINGISYYLPFIKLTNAEIADSFPEWSIEKISQKTGIYCRHIAAKGEFASDMAVSAVNKLISDFNIDLNTIDFLLFCTQSPDYQLPTTACILQDRIGIPKSSGALDFNLGCSGYIYGLGIAKGLIETNQAKNILLVTAETYSKIIHPNDKSNRTIFGDGATATIISSIPSEKYYSAKILNFIYGTDGSKYDCLIVKNSGAKHRSENNSSNFDEKCASISNDDYLYMDGKEIFNFTAFEIPPLINNVLNINSIAIKDITMFIFHQANAYMLDFVRKRCKIPEENFYISMGDVGNTVSSTIPIAFRRLIDENRLKKGDKVVLCGFGVGLSMGGVVIESI